MINRGRRQLLVAGGMLVSLGAAEWLRPRRFLSDSRVSIDWEKAIPTRFGEWEVNAAFPVVIADPQLQQSLSAIYSQTVTRTYVSTGGSQIMLCVAYGTDQSDTTRIHLPEICYPAQGFEVRSEGTSVWTFSDGQRLPVKRLVARLAARVEPVSYWLMVGNDIVLTGSAHKLAQLRYGFSGWIPDGLLVRLSSLNPDSERAYLDQAVFAETLARSLNSVVSERLFGAMDRA